MKRQILGTYLTRVGSVILALGTGMITARALGPHDRGVFALITSFAGMMQAIVGFGYPSAITFFAKKTPSDAKALYSTFLWLALAVGTVVTGVVFLARDLILGTFMKGVSPYGLLVAMLGCQGLVVCSYLSAALVARGNFKAVNTVSLLSKVLMFVGAGLMLGVLNWAMPAYLAYWVLVSWASPLLFLYLLARSSGLEWKLRLNVVQSASAYASKSYLVNVVGFLHYQVDKFILAYFLNPEEVAYYVLAVTLVEFLFYLPDAVGFVLFPALIDQSLDNMRRIASHATRHVLFLTGIGAVLLLLSGRFFINLLYGAAYDSAHVAIPFLTLGAVMMAGFKVLGRYFMSANKQEFIGLVSACSLLANLLCNFVLIPRYGIVGAALASAITYTVSFGAILYAFRRLSAGSVLRAVLVDRDDLRRMYASLRRIKPWVH